MSIKTLIVGLGKIGMMYDFNKDNHYSSHSHSVNYHRKFSLCGGVDLSIKKRNKFHKKFNQIAYKNITEAYEKLSYDLIIISVSTKNVDHVYSEIIKNKIVPQAILFEKPVSYSVKKAKNIFNYCLKHKIKIFVNYNRRYDPSSLYIKRKINSKFIGNIKKVEIFYKKGILNSCSHYINFIQFLFPNKKKLKSIKLIKNLNDDYLADIQMIDKNFMLNFYGLSSGHESIKIQGSNGKFIYFTELNRLYFLDNKKRKYKIKNNYVNGQQNVLKNIYNTLSKKSSPLSSLDDAIESLQYLEKIKKQL